jgi:hypothetical protein
MLKIVNVHRLVNYLEGFMSRKCICISFFLLFFALSVVYTGSASANSTLNITSSNPGSGQGIAFRQAGQTTWQGGATPYAGSFSNGTQLEIVVPFVAYSTGRNIFSSMDGCDSVSYWSDNPSLTNSIICTVTMNTNKTVTFHYSTISNESMQGDTNIFWQNQATGEIKMWFMNGITKESEELITTLPLQWKVTGVADLNHDGKPDMIIHNQTTGDYYLYYLNGSAIVGGQAAGKVSGNAWNIGAIADLNNDVDQDFLWQNQSEGKGYIWLLGFDDWHGLIVKSGQEFTENNTTAATTSDWNIVGTGDFTQDGYQEIVLQNPTNSSISFWFLNGTTQVQTETLLTGKGDANWKVVGVSDFNKDGKPDLLWRNQSAGDNEVWFMNGTTKTGSSSIDNVADSTWEIVGIWSKPYKLPDTGQTTCYNGEGDIITCPLPGHSLAQDGSYNINPLSYTNNDDGTVTDNNTGLMWQKEDDGQARKWDQAISYCDGSNLGEYTDWRLPSKKELISIVNYGIPYPPGPTIDTVFTNTKLFVYWSSTPYAEYTDDAWSVSFANGVDANYGKSFTEYVRCVRGGQINSNFVNNGNGTVTDTRTGLMWQQDESNDIAWEAALSYCEVSTLGNHSDWRLPNIKELESLTDDTRYNPSIDTTFFPNAQLFFWSSTTEPSFSRDAAWGLNFNAGFVYNSHKSISHYSHVRCVRGGQ